jgi:hypothetical protein
LIKRVKRKSTTALDLEVSIRSTNVHDLVLSVKKIRKTNKKVHMIVIIKTEAMRNNEKTTPQ